MDPTKRFSTRVLNYTKYRPSYPSQLITTLDLESRLTPCWTVADIGSGTGILTELFLRNGNRVFAVEPNHEMRQAAERLLAGHSGFVSVSGKAEETGLPEHSVELVAAGQAFHWFHPEKARAEFLRILKPAGWVVLVWNERLTDSTPFLRAYEQLLERHAIDYKQVDHRRVDAKSLEGFYRPEGFRRRTFANQQEFDYEGLKGRLLSSSYAPELGHPGCGEMLRELEAIFEAHSVQEHVVFQYATVMYYGRLNAGPEL